MQQLEMDTLIGESQIFKITFHLKKENSVIIFCSKPVWCYLLLFVELTVEFFEELLHNSFQSL